MKKTDLLFQMLEHHEQYSEAEWHDILADDECRELYTLMAKTKSATLPTEVTNEEIDAEWKCLTHTTPHHAVVIPLWRKIAATIAIIIALFGFTYAAVRTGFFGVEKLLTSNENVHETSQTTQDEKKLFQEEQVEKGRKNAEPHLYDNVALEQILTELSAYYHVDVEYRSEDVRSLRLYYDWQPDYSLDKVIEMLNNFEAFNIHREDNKLVVESSNKQEGKQ